jgi:hypothetical protein
VIASSAEGDVDAYINKPQRRQKENAMKAEELVR